ncbi:signal peptidase I [Nocardioides sp.]|uniref:signal peptidase I n=1 Tax=Nocardioides sp. TaxID=35761 RepID=UPI0031FE4E78|nr:signal peptidase [Nocardioides sp.]
MVTWAWRVMGGLVLLAALAAVSLAVLVPRLAGATPYTVLTGSMSPTMPPGTLVVVRPVDAKDIQIGMVITYQLDSGDPTVVTHRVVAQGFNAKGEPIFRTQGDANDVPDEKWVRPVQIRGEKWYSVQYLGYVSNVLTGKERQMGVYLTAAGLMGYALLMFASSVRDNRRRVVEKESVHV